MVYDAWNRLVKVYDDNNANGEADAGELFAIYSYDGLNRRIHKAHPVGGEWLVKDFYYDTSWRLLEYRCNNRNNLSGTFFGGLRCRIMYLATV